MTHALTKPDRRKLLKWSLSNEMHQMILNSKKKFSHKNNNNCNNSPPFSLVGSLCVFGEFRRLQLLLMSHSGWDRNFLHFISRVLFICGSLSVRNRPAASPSCLSSSLFMLIWRSLSALSRTTDSGALPAASSLPPITDWWTAWRTNTVHLVRSACGDPTGQTTKIRFYSKPTKLPLAAADSPPGSRQLPGRLLGQLQD